MSQHSRHNLIAALNARDALQRSLAARTRPKAGRKLFDRVAANFYARLIAGAVNFGSSPRRPRPRRRHCRRRCQMVAPPLPRLDAPIAAAAAKHRRGAARHAQSNVPVSLPKIAGTRKKNLCPCFAYRRVCRRLDECRHFDCIRQLEALEIATFKRENRRLDRFAARQRRRGADRRCDCSRRAPRGRRNCG